MNHVDHLNLFGVEAKEIPCIKGEGAPTTATEGAVGCFYMDTDTGRVYKCTAVTDGVYTWQSADGADVVQTTGDSETAVMSQKAVATALGDIPVHVGSINKFDRNSPLIKSGYYEAGGYRENSSYKVSHPIYVKYGMTYRWPHDTANVASNRSLAIVDKENNLVRLEHCEVTDGYASFTANFTGFISVNVGKQSADGFMVCLAEEYPEQYTPYKPLLAAHVKGENILDLTVTKEQTDFLENVCSDNLFNKDDVLRGYYFNIDQKALVVGSTSFFGYVPITHAGTYQLMVAGQLFGLTGACQIPCFKENKEYIKLLYATTADTTGTTENKATLTITEDELRISEIAYIGLSGRLVALDKAMVVEADTYPSSYIPYSNEWHMPCLTFTDEQRVNLSSLYGKIISFNGDSICYGEGFIGGYGKIIAERNAMTYENIGVSGGTVTEGTGAHCISSSVLNMREDADYVILEGGVNDMVRDNLGAISNGFNATLDATTFCGAFEQMLKNAITRFPAKKIGYISVHRLKQWAPDNYNTQYTNTGYYEKAIEICKKWGIPVCDLTIGCPSLYENDSLKQNYTHNGDGWHPNEDGYMKYYVPKIEAWLKTL